MSTSLPSGAFVAPSKEDARLWRASLFQHLDGLALSILCPVLKERGILDALASESEVDVDDLAGRLGANPGYLNVVCRLLASQG